MQGKELEHFSKKLLEDFQTVILTDPGNRQELGTLALRSLVSEGNFSDYPHLRVLDVGGGTNPFRASIDMERPSMHVHVLEQRQLVRALEGQLKFFNASTEYCLIDETGLSPLGYGLTYFGTSLQYVSNWRELIYEPTGMPVQHVVITDTPVSLGETFDGIQRNLGQHPFKVRFESKADIKDFFRSKGFSLRAEIAHGKSFHRHRERDDWEFWSAWFSR